MRIIGLSCNFIEPALCHGKLDGIGTFTQALLQQLSLTTETVQPVVFPSRKILKEAYKLPQVHLMKQPYALSAGIAALTGSPMLGTTVLEEKIDLYHCTDYLIPRLKKTPVLAMLHDAVKIQHPDWNSRRFRHIKMLGLKKAIRWANHYIAPSKAVIPELVEYFGIEEKDITVIHNAICDEWFEPIAFDQTQAVLNKFNLRPGFLLFAGTFQPRKNLARLLAAFKNLPLALQKEHPLVLVGQRGWIDETLIQDLRRYHDQGIVHWLHYVTQDELRSLYQSAALFLLPSLHEGFGLPILEAFASGTPVITSNIFAMPEVAGDAACLINPYSIDALREAILDLLQNPARREDLMLRGKKRVEAFRWERCREKVIQVYNIF